MTEGNFNQSCPHCSAKYQIGPNLSGKRVKCGKCGKEFLASSSPPPFAPTLSPVEEPERFEIKTDASTRRLHSLRRTRSQNVNQGIAIALAVSFALLLVGLIVSMIDGNSNLNEDIGAVITGILGPFLLVAFGLLYFAPTIVAYSRDHNNTLPIMVINAVFGWTLLGWVCCFAWSLSSDIKESRVYVKKVIVQKREDDWDD